VINEFFVTV